jgi:hypothetical protein
MCVGLVGITPALQGLLCPPILVKDARKLGWNCLTPLIVDGYLSIQENLDDFLLILMNPQFGTKPKVPSTLLYE